MTIGRADKRDMPFIPVARSGRRFVWHSFAEPIWASGHEAALTGRTHERTRPPAVLCQTALNPRAHPRMVSGSTRSGQLQLHISRLPTTEEASSKRKRSNETGIGYIHIESCELRSAEGKLHTQRRARCASPSNACPSSSVSSSTPPRKWPPALPSCVAWFRPVAPCAPRLPGPPRAD